MAARSFCCPISLSIRRCFSAGSISSGIACPPYKKETAFPVRNASFPIDPKASASWWRAPPGARPDPATVRRSGRVSAIVPIGRSMARCVDPNRVFVRPLGQRRGSDRARESARVCDPCGATPGGRMWSTEPGSPFWTPPLPALPKWKCRPGSERAHVVSPSKHVALTIEKATWEPNPRPVWGLAGAVTRGLKSATGTGR